jgi:hypothetical protein
MFVSCCSATLSTAADTEAGQACCLEVSGLAGAWRECGFNQKEETHPGSRTNATL